MELFIDKSNNEFNGMDSFSVFCDILISAACLAATQWGPACVREMDDICSGYISTLTPWAPAQPYLRDARFCAIGLERQTAPFQEMSYFLPIQNTLMEIMARIRYYDG